MMPDKSILPTRIVNRMIRDRTVRIGIVRKSHLLFFHFYFAHYVKYPTAKFQREMFQLAEQTKVRNFFVAAFRGSGKSTIITLSYALWAILGDQQKKYVVIFCQTRIQARQVMMNLRAELESNNLLKSDLGPFKEESDEWGSFSLVFKNLKARITVASVEQSVRGLRQQENRPDLVICDDIEDSASVKNQEGRDKTYNWLTGEVIPLGDKSTRLVVVGNLLHEDAIMMRLKRDIEEGRRDGVIRFYPLIGENGIVAWPGKYPTVADIETERKKVANEIAWQREYLLRIVPDEGQVVFHEWIHRYEKLPADASNFRFAALGVDLAISEKRSADYTAIVSAMVYGRGRNRKIYILPNPVNKKMDFHKTIEKIKETYLSLRGGGIPVKIFVESVGYQKSASDQLTSEGYPAEEFIPRGEDKRSRLAATTHLIQSGQILFPTKGCENLIAQLVGFGIERYDDLADAFTVIVHKILEKDRIELPSGFTPLVRENTNNISYVKDIPFAGQKRLGVALMGLGREYTVIVLRTNNAAQVLFRERTDDLTVIAAKVVEIAGLHKIPLIKGFIAVDDSDVGESLCAKIKPLLGHKPNPPNYYYAERDFGAGWWKEPWQNEPHRFDTIRSRCYWLANDWLTQARLIGTDEFDDFEHIGYTEKSDGKISVMNRRTLDTASIDASASDALALTFTDLPPETRYWKQPPYKPMSVFESPGRGEDYEEPFLFQEKRIPQDADGRNPFDMFV